MKRNNIVKQGPRDQFIKFRVTAEERQRVHQMMQETGFHSEAAFLRATVFKVKPIVKVSDSLTDIEIMSKLVEIKEEVRRVGVNFNQIVAKANSSKLPLDQAFKTATVYFQSILTLQDMIYRKLDAYLNNPNIRL